MNDSTTVQFSLVEISQDQGGQRQYRAEQLRNVLDLVVPK